jgi:hypothetical protein
MYKASEGWNDHLFQVPPELMVKLFEMCVKEGLDVNEFLTQGFSIRARDLKNERGN